MIPAPTRTLIGTPVRGSVGVSNPAGFVFCGSVGAGEPDGPGELLADALALADVEALADALALALAEVLALALAEVLALALADVDFVGHGAGHARWQPYPP